MLRTAPTLPLSCLALLALCAGCRDAPAEVLGNARNALAARNEVQFLALVEPRAAALLRNMPEVMNKSGRQYKVLRDGKPGSNLLPKGDVADVVESGKRAVVVVKQGRAASQVPMRLIEGQWRIDLLEMDSFHEAIRPLE